MCLLPRKLVNYCIFLYSQNKILPNNGIFPISIKSSDFLPVQQHVCLLLILDFLSMHIAHFDKIIVFPFLILEALAFIIYLLSLYFKQYDSFIISIEFTLQFSTMVRLCLSFCLKLCQLSSF